MKQRLGMGIIRFFYATLLFPFNFLAEWFLFIFSPSRFARMLKKRAMTYSIWLPMDDHVNFRPKKRYAVKKD